MTDLDFTEVSRQLYESSFSHFVRAAWQHMEPTEYQHNWHIDVICQEIQDIIDGLVPKPRGLLVNQPPRTMKSLLLSVCLPAWIWSRRKRGSLSGPQVRFLSASYSEQLSFDLSLKCRNLIGSPWYQSFWANRFVIARDTIAVFENSAGGARRATSVNANLTGMGGDIIIVDDAHNTQEVESEADRLKVVSWWTQAVPSRFNNPKTGIFVVVMQRQHVEDLSGYILANDVRGEWRHVRLPMRYDRDISTGHDPRQTDGELLWPERFDEPSVQTLERSLGPYGTAGQLQQIPTTKGGGIIQRDWWRPWYSSTPPIYDYVITSVDTAYTEKQENDPSAITVWGIFHEKSNSQPRVMLIWAWEDHLPIHDLVLLIDTVASGDRDQKLTSAGLPMSDLVLIENKAAGISVRQELRRIFSRSTYAVEFWDPKSQDKVARVHAVVPLFSEGLVFAPFLEGKTPRRWAGKVIEQAAAFPKAARDDLVDTTSMALRYLRDQGLLLRKVEHAEAQYRKGLHRRSLTVPYDV